MHVCTYVYAPTRPHIQTQPTPPPPEARTDLQAVRLKQRMVMLKDTTPSRSATQLICDALCGCVQHAWRNGGLVGGEGG